MCKPSEFTSLTAYMLCDAFLRAGLPEGVVNMVFGYGYSVGNELVLHKETSAISFTGNYNLYKYNLKIKQNYNRANA